MKCYEEIERAAATLMEAIAPRRPRLGVVLARGWARLPGP